MKNKKQNLSFKKEKVETGLGGVGYPNPDTIIKLNKLECGKISGPSWRTKDNLWHVSFMVKSGDSWRLVRLKKAFEKESEAREFIKRNWDAINEKYELYQFED